MKIVWAVLRGVFLIFGSLVTITASADLMNLPSDAAVFAGLFLLVLLFVCLFLLAYVYSRKEIKTDAST